MCAAVVVAAFSVSTQAAERTSKKDFATFGAITPPSEVKVRADSANWLKEAGKYDDNRKAFDALWSDANKSVLDKVAGTFALGDPEVAKLLTAARDPQAPAPTSLPEVLQDSKKSTFFRANLALAYSKGLVCRKVYEEALDTLKLFKVEQVLDPAGYLFFKAVAEYGLMEKKAANDTIARLVDDVPTAPERYKMVAYLMHFDMVSWQDRNVLDKLGTVGRKMDNIQRRLALERGGKKTQKQQKEVVARLDELIKELENMSNSDCPSCPNGGNCPSGGQAKGNGPPKGGTNQPSSPATESGIANNSGPGQIDPKRIKELAEVWGKLPAREREANMIRLLQEIDPRYREICQEYFRRLDSRATP